MVRIESKMLLTLDVFENAGYNQDMVNPNEEDKLLVAGLQSGDEQAFRALVEKYQARAFSVAFGYMKDAEEAKDVVQESFIRVYEKVKSFKGDSKFYTWYYRLLINLCLDTKRKQKISRVFSIFKAGSAEEGGGEYAVTLKENEAEGPEEKHARSEVSKKIEGYMEKLSPKEKQVFELKNYQGFKIREVADIMGIKEGTVKVLLFRAVQKLKIMLGDGEYENM